MWEPFSFFPVLYPSLRVDAEMGLFRSHGVDGGVLGRERRGSGVGVGGWVGGGGGIAYSRPLPASHRKRGMLKGLVLRPPIRTSTRSACGAMNDPQSNVTHTPQWTKAAAPQTMAEKAAQSPVMRRVVGIAGIQRQKEQERQETEQEIQQAFADLNSLMDKVRKGARARPHNKFAQRWSPCPHGRNTKRCLRPRVPSPKVPAMHIHSGPLQPTLSPHIRQARDMVGIAQRMQAKVARATLSDDEDAKFNVRACLCLAARPFVASSSVSCLV